MNTCSVIKNFQTLVSNVISKIYQGHFCSSQALSQIILLDMYLIGFSGLHKEKLILCVLQNLIAMTAQTVKKEVVDTQVDFITEPCSSQHTALVDLIRGPLLIYQFANKECLFHC